MRDDVSFVGRPGSATTRAAGFTATKAVGASVAEQQVRDDDNRRVRRGLTDRVIHPAARKGVAADHRQPRGSTGDAERAALGIDLTGKAGVDEAVASIQWRGGCARRKGLARGA